MTTQAPGPDAVGPAVRLLDLPPEMLAMLWPAQRRSHGRESCKALRRCLEPGSKNCTKELCWVFLNVPRFVSSAHLEERLVFLVGLCRRVKVSMGVSGRDHTDGDLKSLTLSRKAFWNLLGQGMIMKLLSMLPRLCACDPGAMRAWVRDFCRLTKEGCADLERRFLGAVRQGKGPIRDKQGARDVRRQCVMDATNMGSLEPYVADESCLVACEGGAGLRVQTLQLWKSFEQCDPVPIREALRGLSPYTKRLALCTLRVQCSFFLLEGYDLERLTELELHCNSMLALPKEACQNLQAALSKCRSLEQVMVKGYSQCQSQLYSVLFTAFRATPRLVVYWHHGVDPKLVKFLLGPGGVPDDRSMLDIVHLCIDTSPWVYDFRDERLDGVRESFPGTIKHLSLRASHCNPRAVQVLALLIGRLHLTLKTLRILGLNYMLFLELIDSIMDGCWHVYQYSQEGENGYTVTFP